MTKIVMRCDGPDWRGPWVLAVGRYGVRFYWDGWGYWGYWSATKSWAHLGPLSVLWWVHRPSGAQP